MAAESQKDIVAFLASEDNHGGAAVRQIDTHLSHIFIAGDLVYKIKRSVRYDFADLSSLERRRRSCENEIAVNRPMAGAMYHGVVPLYRGPDGIAWDGQGEVAEWAVKMARFDEGGQFDELIAHDRLNDAMMRRLGDRLAAFHLDAERISDDGAAGDVEPVIEEIATGLQAYALGTERSHDIARWRDLAAAAYRTCRSLLEARRRAGLVRHCHGDLHLANICLFQGEVTPFDAVEFNDELARIDVLYDLAFVLMDLICYRRRDLANILMNRYLGKTRDYAGLALLPLFLSLRAGVRAMVLSLPSQPEKAAGRAGLYLDLALELIERRDPVALFAFGGYSGSGKSTAARAFALQTDHPAGMVILHSDEIRKRMLGEDPEKRLAEDGYSRTITARVYDRLYEDGAQALQAGWPVILDATFLDDAERERVEALSQREAVPLQGVWLTAPRSVLFGRIAARPQGASDATAQVLSRQLEHGRDPDDWAIVNTECGLAATLDCIRSLVGVDSHARQ
ncbi:AAA family ATPase [Aquisalinus flavus]|uniref:Kinase n=1 Tax=Aquisalinus flavus TaxID=1526572 RepID=A0A8J2V3C6_9PROT|nr:bifunctional aminoglycoside phosphotransferase/ATP-binding protein [Aquisalinus flavus]MBD0426036.1 AAA family ATPase [Aquisalinus flavus]UNE48373.1 AAA family ATPase [Aquisalinus flavus]GGD11233.1 kinase [Aquisalinus flavus]